MPHLSAAQSPTVTDPLQQAYAGVQHYAGDPALLPSLLSSFVCLFESIHCIYLLGYYSRHCDRQSLTDYHLLLF